MNIMSYISITCSRFQELHSVKLKIKYICIANWVTDFNLRLLETNFTKLSK